MKFFKTPEGYWINSSQVRYFEIIPRSYVKKQIFYEAIAVFGTIVHGRDDNQVEFAAFDTEAEAEAYLAKLVDQLNAEDRG